MDVDQGARWDFLRPWCAPLRGLLVLRVQNEMCVPSKRFAGVLFQLPKDLEHPHPGQLRAIGDAIVLLAMVARADHSAWRYVLKAHCELDLDTLESYREAEDYRIARFALKLWVTDGSEAWIAELIKTLVEGIVAPPSAAFTVAAKRIVGGFDRDSRCLEIPIRFMFTLAWADRIGLPRFGMIQNALRAIKKEHDGWCIPINLTAVGHKQVPIECTAVLEPMEMNLEADSLTPIEINTVTEMLRKENTIPLSYLTFMPQMHRKLNIDSARTAQMIGKVFERVFCGGTSAPSEVHTIGTVCLSWMLREVAPIARLCSALLETRTVTRLQLSLDSMLVSRREPSEAWAFIAFALFSDVARERSSITHVELIDAIITQSDVDAMEAVLSSNSPVNYLYNNLYDELSRSDVIESTTNAATRWILKRGSPVTLQKMHPDETILPESATWTLDSDVAGISLLSDTDPGCAVVVIPGYGVCEVNRRLLVPIDMSDALSGQRLKRGVSSLSLPCVISPEAGEALYRFLELVGTSLVRLKLSSFDLDLDVGRVIRACPNLKTLIIQEVEIDTHEFLEAYRSCNAQISEIECCFDNVSAISADLKDTQTKIAQTLKRLSLELLLADDLEEDQIETFPQMLQTNRTLEFVSVRARLDDFVDTAQMPSAWTHGMILPVAKAPYPLSCRLAFLSLFSKTQISGGSGTKRSKTEIPPLTSVFASFPVNRHVISIIFAYAAERVHRRVYSNLGNLISNN